jgi:Leucine rich repeat
MFDNMINRIEDDTFSKLLNLEALDLSGNGLLEVPAEVFNLPLLRNLYIADNSFTDRGFGKVQELAKPLKAPLKILNIANNRLFKMPDLGVLPMLYTLNVSVRNFQRYVIKFFSLTPVFQSNSMRDLTPQQFSPFCNIKEIDLNNTNMEKCRCEEVTRFLYRKREAILMSSFYCDAISSGEHHKLCSTISWD